MMEFVYFLCAISAVLALHAASACSVKNVQECITPLTEGYSTVSGSKAQNHTAVCETAKTAMDCLRVEMSTCSGENKQIQTSLNSANKMMDLVTQMCNNPDLVDQLNNGLSEDCRNAKIESCFTDLNTQHTTKEEGCLRIGAAKQCVAMIMRDCDGSILKQLIATQLDMINKVEKYCKENGYSTDPNSLAGKNLPTVGIPFLATAIFVFIRYWI